MLTDARWAVLEPLVEQCRPHAKVPPANLRRTVSAILRRHASGAKWRSVPAEFGPLGSRGGSRPMGRMIGAADHGGWRRRPSSAGRGWGYGSAR
jgi:transposase